MSRMVLVGMVGFALVAAATVEASERLFPKGNLGASCTQRVVAMPGLVAVPMNQRQLEWCARTETGVRIRFGVEMGRNGEGVRWAVEHRVDSARGMMVDGGL